MRFAAVGVSLVTVVATGLLAAPAQAASTGVVSITQTTKIRYKAGSGHRNRVVVTRSGNTITVDDQVAIKAGAGCKAIKGDKTKIRCTPTKAPTRIQVFTGDRSDRVENRTDLRIVVDGGTGNDTLIGGPLGDRLDGNRGNNKLYGLGGADVLYGSSEKDRIWGGDGHDDIYGAEGDDVLSGGVGDDYVSQGVGDDRVYGGAGHDTFLMYDNKGYGGSDDDYLSGGTGFDSVNYEPYKRSVTADADGVKGDDGGTGEHDTIATDVEELHGGSGNDRLYGTAGKNVLYGYDGDDVIYGLGGDDMLNGEAGKDKVYGGAGDDWVYGDDRDQPNGKDLPDGGADTDHCPVQGADVKVACEG